MPPVKPAATKPADNSGCIGAAIVIGAIFFLLLIVGKCSSNTTSNTADLSASNMAAENISSAVAAQGPPPVQPLSEPAVKEGLAQLRLAEKAESLSGAMIYSENCYDALSHQFSWSKLDSCGAADMLAVRTLPELDLSSLDSEAKYFESEAAAGRYLAAATGAGEAADEADRRLSQLQARVKHTPLPVHKPAVVPDDRLMGNDVDGNVAIPLNETDE
ncbi:MAG: hypothetical protein QOH32_4400 [Bradyrhizobium sp.]|jgi:hypothetical protein|nr:hypothetical protein [Bradyrhizobium sp.]